MNIKRQKLSMHELISIVFSAPFIALYLIIRLVLDNVIGLAGLFFSILWLVLIPIIIPLYYASIMNIEWDYPERHHRIKPFLLIVIGYLVLTITSIFLLEKELVFISASYTINGLAAWLTNLKYKISIHMIGISGPATALLLLGYYVDAITLYIIGLITAYSRMTMKRHTPGQIITGFLTGMILTTIVYLAVKP